MSNTTFTMHHYNKIHALIKSNIDGFKADSNMISNEDVSYVAGMQVLHDQLGAMFQKDNPNFKPELWKI